MLAQSLLNFIESCQWTVQCDKKNEMASNENMMEILLAGCSLSCGSDVGGQSEESPSC